MSDNITIRIALRRFGRSVRTGVGTFIGAGLYTLGRWMEVLAYWMRGQSAKPERPDDPVAGPLYDMQKYINIWSARHFLSYTIIKDEAEDYRRPYPSQEEYDQEKQIPTWFKNGDLINTHEVNYICGTLGYDETKVIELIQHNPRLVMNYLRATYWDHWSKSKE